jgi:hypothetical protein
MLPDAEPEFHTLRPDPEPVNWTVPPVRLPPERSNVAMVVTSLESVIDREPPEEILRAPWRSPPSTVWAELRLIELLESAQIQSPEPGTPAGDQFASVS